ncbi:Ni,Fe-hydrogenase I large subunit [Halanaerobacter jeridensis]|uniref:Ni,Fe-hydrogenase I large subunit n=1 Tax=Halanaerobacter jeridensis TaxID=706427 RepID=A0A938XU39_9FIRM|nr:Ni,Fe-hydrogenase I large subunit [Halanaerobacter jeridensis]
MSQTINFSPVTRLSGLLSVKVVIDDGWIKEANAKGTMFRGYEKIMQGRKVTDAVYLTQRVCGICSLAHGAVGSYLLDELYGSTLSQRAQYLRNIMLVADFLQNHIRHFYFFSLPDFVEFPNRPPWQNQNLVDGRLKPKDNQRLVGHYFDAVKVAQEAHEILALFGGKAPHQHSFVQGGVAVAPTADKINRAQALLANILQFIREKLIPDTELLAQVYNDYFKIGVTPKRLISCGLFKFGEQNQDDFWPRGVINGRQFAQPDVDKIEETVANSWFEEEDGQLEPAPDKPGAYSWTKSV